MKKTIKKYSIGLLTLVGSLLITTLGFAFFYILLDSKGTKDGLVNFIWEIRYIFIFIYVVICYLFFCNKEKHSIYYDISIPLISAFIGIFLALRISDYHDKQEEKNIYNSYLLSISIELKENMIDSQLMMSEIQNLRSTGKGVVFTRLSDSHLLNAIHNPLFIREATPEIRLLMYLIDSSIVRDNRKVDEMASNLKLYNDEILVPLDEDLIDLRIKINHLKEDINFNDSMLGITDKQMLKFKADAITFNFY